MPTPFPHQLEAAIFLSDRPRALLASEPRVGKTGSAIMAADYVLAENLLVVTTASGRPVWRRAMVDWSPFQREVQVLDGKRDLSTKTQVAIVGWGGITNPQIRSQLLRRKWDAVLPDECHFAKSFDAKRTQALYGELRDGGKSLDNTHALAADQAHIWPLSGTPAPNSPADLYPMLRALKPFCLAAHDGMPDVTKEQDFLHRYCVVRMKKISNFRKIPVVVGGRNADELKRRIGDFLLRRTQAEVGIREPIYETFPLIVSERMKREAFGRVDAQKVLDAAVAGDTKTLEMHMGPLRRLTGEMKARAMVDVVRDEFDCGLDKIVLAYWHKDVSAILKEGLAEYGVVGIDGATPAAARGEAEQRFLNDPKIRVFLGQIQAAGEAIDLSSAALLVFVETSFTPKDMAQMSKRITNHTQRRQPIVRVAVLEGSIDEALENILIRKWSAIRNVLS
jgi:SWI/SNF-related matrix-associated actin-dependent regulator 1 of chromatin subfamily A